MIWGDHRQVRIVIEAKDSRQELDETVRRQAQSYAFGLSAPTYVLANGRTLQIYQRGVHNDTCVVDCIIENLPQSWAAVEQAMGANT